MITKEYKQIITYKTMTKTKPMNKALHSLYLYTGSLLCLGLGVALDYYNNHVNTLLVTSKHERQINGGKPV